MQKTEFAHKRELFKAILDKNELAVCEYFVKEDRLVIYDDTLFVDRVIPDYLDYLQNGSSVCPEDRWKIRDFLQGKLRGKAEIRISTDNTVTKLLFQVLPIEGTDLSVCFPVIVRNITKEKHREALLEDRATKDSLTMLYNHFFGRELINEYLNNKEKYGRTER